MAKEMLINVSEGEECRIALVEDGRLEELYIERTSSTSHVGNVYKGRVTNVEPSIQAAFVDFGLGRNGFLHISDLMPTYFGGKADDYKESVGRKMARRDRPPIQKCLRRGDEIIVQIIKEGIGTKGPTLSTYVSIPGRILVMMPGMSKLGVSRKIEDEEERKRLRQILDSLKPPKDCGFIIRTAGVGKSKVEIERDLKYLTRLHENISKKAQHQGPMELYAEGDLVTRTVRDVITGDVDRIVVDHEDVAKKIKEFFKLIAPRTKNKVELYAEPVPLFHKYGIEKEIELMYSRHVPLPSGGSLVIDSTEAIVAIDVNSGKFRDHADAETTAFKTDLEAADEIPRQLKLRDLGGVIICDFIDLRFERHRRELEKRLHDNLKNDRAKTKMLRMSQFGIIEMTRQRMRPSLKRSIYADCPHCKGAGLVKTPESMSLDVMRRLAIGIHDERVVRVQLAVCGEVAFYLQNRKRIELATLEHESGKHIMIGVDPSLGLDEMRLELFDERDGLVNLPELGVAPADHQHGGRGQEERRPGRGGRDRDRRGGRDRGRGRGDGRRGRRGEEPVEEHFEHAEEEIEQREEEREEIDRPEEIESPRREQDEREPEEELAGEEADVSDIEPAPSAAFEDEEAAEPPGEIEDTGEGADEEPAAEEPDDQVEEEAQAEPVGRSHEDEPGGDQGYEEEQYEEQPPVQRHQPRQPQPQPQLQPKSPYDEYEEEIELQPQGITHERPTLKEQARGGRRGGGRRGGKGGRYQQAPPEVSGPAKRGETELSLAERFAMELAAEKAQRRQGGGGGQGQPGAHRPQQQHQPQHPRQQHQPHQQGQPRQEGGQGQGGRRRRRGRRGRGRGGNGGGQGGGGQRDGYGGGGYDAGNDDAPAEQHQNRPQQPAPQAPAPQPRPAPAPQPPVKRTGSTDRHLLHDEPVLPQPISRPRSYRDLDQIPDDLD